MANRRAPSDGHGKAECGFTTAERVAAIAILASLATLAVPAWLNCAADSRLAKVALTVAPDREAIELCAETGGCVSATQMMLGDQADDQRAHERPAMRAARAAAHR